MAQRQPIVFGADGLPQQLQAADTTPLPAYGASGVVAGCKIWQGEVVTTTGGAWTVDLSSAGFTAAPRVIPQALSLGTTIQTSAKAVLTARSPTAASGFVNIPLAVVVGGYGEQRAGTGITVMVIAVGP